MRSRFRNANTAILGLLLLLVGAGTLDYVIRVSTLDPARVQKKRREAFVKQWKPAYLWGTTPPPFELSGRDGKRHFLAQLHDKPLVLTFYSDDKRSEIFARELQKIWNHIGRPHLRSVAVVDFDRARAEQFIKTTGDKSLYLYDAPGEHSIHHLYAAAPGPNCWVISSEGKVIHASPPIEAVGVPEDDLQGVYRGLRSLIPLDPIKPEDGS